MKYSIIIPTYNHLIDCLKPCLDSILKNTDLTDMEIIVISNGSTDGTNEYLIDLKYSIKELQVIIHETPLGYSRAINMGIEIATGEFLILLNNDCIVLDYCAKNEWLELLHQPFSDEKIGITGPSKLYTKENSDFIIFFCAMLRKKMLDDIGLLDTIFSIGSGEDIDICLRAKKMGWKIKKVGTDTDEWSYATTYPIYHRGEATVHDKNLVSEWEKIYENNMKIITERTLAGEYWRDMAIVIAPFAQKMRDGKQNPKNFSMWPEVVAELRTRGVTVIQVGAAGDESIGADEMHLGLKLREVEDLVRRTGVFACVDTFIQHLGQHVGARGTVIFSKSDHKVFGYHTNENLGGKGLRPDQFGPWEACEWNHADFPSVGEVVDSIMKQFSVSK